jgi:copper homeostasis protein
MVVLEVCVEGLSGVCAAKAAGAERVELCCALALGGLTPSRASLESALAVGGIDVVVLVRPRPGDFVYSAEEFATLAADVEHARASGAAGVALGCLSGAGELDTAHCAELVARAAPLPVTFHRAFDHVREPRAALETLVELRFARVLSSGQAASAWEGRERLAELAREARGRITLVAAGGVRAHNARALVEASGVSELHFSASRPRPGAARFRNRGVRLAASPVADELGYLETELEAITELRAALRGSAPSGL